MKKQFIFISLVSTLIFSCKKNEQTSDATGTFEATETIISSEVAGKILQLNLEEGDTLALAQKVGNIDVANLQLQEAQIEASIKSLPQKFNDASAQIKVLENQIAVQKEQLHIQQREFQRLTNLVKSEAVPSKQLDDMEGAIALTKKQISVLESQISAQKTQVTIQNRSINSELSPLEKRADQVTDQIKRGEIINPVRGTVLTKYAEQYEMTAPGKALYKVADLSEMILKVYVSGNQLTKVQLNQPVKVLIDKAEGQSDTLQGKVYWIASKAEFTPKTIQTKEERANLVYAVKIRVKNTGALKIGMYGEVIF
ncbi:HlyD family secretion protein [Cellulophaga sp. BC115SP]|uniref:HlyD family secretion protein n=1 Tax=Cellulophaga sp. BC115SP TaxID=2683263 RepID=UPI001412290C|nr:HlyD family efflux transporter periplasmic adaptor subunit [Cellulophaga sp. BC115SP]NBB27817.1 HlyD family efflux transporter periplasmic adaptor subunit [Cellulophaga sp. BC115SP]